MNCRMIRSAIIIFSFGVLPLLATSAQASSIYQSGFESPTYTVGGLDGQDGWSAFANATVQTSTVFAGTQAASIEANGLSGQYVAAHALTYNSVANPDAQVDITGEFFISTAGSGTNWDIAAVLGNAGFIGQLTVVDSSFVQLGIVSANLGNVPISRGVWNSFDMILNYATDIQSAYINGTFVGQGSFASASTTLDDYNFGINGTSGSDTLSLDDLSITAVPVPSSALMGVALLGGLMVAQTIRRRQPVEA
jgi:hypothetical protein